MGPRADFSCAKCAQTYEDLPVASSRCPVCGLKRGFKRLFNAVQVARPASGRVAAMIEPMLEQKQTLMRSRQAIEARQRQFNLDPAQPIRSPMPAPGQGPGAAGFLSALPGDARSVSQSINAGLIGQKIGAPRPHYVGVDPTPLQR